MSDPFDNIDQRPGRTRRDSDDRTEGRGDSTGEPSAPTGKPEMDDITTARPVGNLTEHLHHTQVHDGRPARTTDQHDGGDSVDASGTSPIDPEVIADEGADLRPVENGLWFNSLDGEFQAAPDPVGAEIADQVADLDPAVDRPWSNDQESLIGSEPPDTGEFWSAEFITD